MLARVANEAGLDTRLSQDERTDIAEHYAERAGVLLEGVRDGGVFQKSRQSDDFENLPGGRTSPAAVPAE